MDGLSRTQAELLRNRLIQERRTALEMSGRLTAYRREFARGDHDVDHNLDTAAEVAADLSNYIGRQIDELVAWLAQ